MCVSKFLLIVLNSLMPLSQLLHFVCLGLSRPLYSGNQLFVGPVNLLLLDGDLLLPLHHLDLNLLQPDLLLLLSRLQLVCQLGFCFLKTSADFQVRQKAQNAIKYSHV